MEFREEAFVDREMEIATCLLKDLSINKISFQIAVSKKIIRAHVRNMMKKLDAENIEDLVRLLKEKTKAIDFNS